MAEKGIQKTTKPVTVDGEDVEIAPGSVQSVTTETPHAADESSQPGPYDDLELNRPPVSTNDPEQPIAHSLVAGAGAPQTLGPDEIHPETHVASNAYVSKADKPNIDQAHIEAQAAWGDPTENELASPDADADASAAKTSSGKSK